MKSYPFTAARVFGTPLLIHPTKGKVIAQALSERFNITHIEVNGATPNPRAEDDGGDYDFGADLEVPPFDIVQGIAVVPVCGTLIHRGNSLRPYSGMLGYNAIAQNFLTALHDDNVLAVVLDCNSPGGEVAGCFDLVDLIFNSRGDKPIVAVLDDMAYSAAYAIASACDQVVVPRTGGTGSVGVVAMHVDKSKAINGAGLEVTIFQYGARKADGNEYMPLSNEARERFQADIDSLGELFVDTVARNRGLTTARVKATEAGTYMGAQSVDVGFADAVLAPDEAFRTLLAELG